MKVLQNFFCAKTKVSYKKGDNYKGDRAEELARAGKIEKALKVVKKDAAPKKTSNKNAAPKGQKNK